MTFIKNRAWEKFSVFKQLEPQYSVTVKPNARNKISIDVRGDVEKSTKPIPYKSFIGLPLRMDKKIMKSAFGVLEKVKLEKQQETEREKLNKRISKIEELLQQIKEKLPNS